VRDVCAFAGIVAEMDVIEGRGDVWPRLFYCESEKRLPFILSSAFLVLKNLPSRACGRPRLIGICNPWMQA